MSSQLQNQSGVATLQSIGAVGSKEITGTSAVTPPTGYYFFCIQFVGDSVVSARVDVTGAVNANLTSFTSGFSDGSAVYGKWSSITLSSGSAMGYLARL
jgi:hypothetical protein